MAVSVVTKSRIVASPCVEASETIAHIGQALKREKVTFKSQPRENPVIVWTKQRQLEPVDELVAPT